MDDSNSIVLIVAGGAVGFFAATGRELLMAWFTHRRERKEADEADATERRKAMRLVLVELNNAIRTIERAVRDGEYWDASVRLLPAHVWNREREVLARAPSGTVKWEQLAEAFEEIDRLNWVAGERRADEARATTIESETQDDIDQALRQMRAAAKALSRAIGD